MPEGWRVLTSRQVLDRWETRSTYSAEALVAFWDWVLARTQDGPPHDAVRVHDDDDLFLAVVPGTNLVVSFLAITQDQVLILKEID